MSQLRSLVSSLSSCSAHHSRRLFTAFTPSHTRAFFNTHTSHFSTTSSSVSTPPTYRPRRALLYMPGSNLKMLKKAPTIQVDTVCLDLEDSVSFNQKEQARANILETLNEWPMGPSERLVRINPIGSGLEEEDIKTILSASNLPDGLVIPKIENATQVQWIDSTIDKYLKANNKTSAHIALVALIESTEGIINLREIVRSSSRLQALIFGADDYRASVGAIKTPSNHEVSFARNSVLLYAKSAGLDAIDLVQTDFTDLNVITKESVEGFELGYTGKQIIHPKQIDVVQKCFSPNERLREWAKKVVLAAQENEKNGTGAFTVDGQMVDLPLIKKARQIIARCKACNIAV